MKRLQVWLTLAGLVRRGNFATLVDSGLGASPRAVEVALDGHIGGGSVE